MNNLLIYKCETPLHVGGESSLDIVDMPIQREKHTDFPKVEASSIKGAYRQSFSKYIKENSKNDYKSPEKIVDTIFGSENDSNAYRGGASFLDSRILLFPVKSPKGIFAWITCPYVLDRLKRDLVISNNMKEDIYEYEIPLEIKENEAHLINESSNLTINDNYIYLEEFGYVIKSRNENKLLSYIIENMNDKNQQDEKILDSYISEKLKKDIVIVSDEVFSYFINMSTEINTRIKIGENGVVEEGKLFTEEYLPSETIMYNFINLEDKIYIDKNSENLTEKIVQEEFETYINELSYIHFGGNTTLGKGILSVFNIK